jgi:pimeloyl-ACP methyl ester carboxylesterase
VLLVGHSYGGAVISVAGAAAANVVGLVYVAAFALDEGESFAEIFERSGATPLMDAMRPSNDPVAGGDTAVELSIAPELYRSAFAADLPSDVTEVWPSRSARSLRSSTTGHRPRRGRRLPSWAIVATADNAIPPDAERHMAARAGAQTVEVDASHSIALSQPTAVADLIRTAVSAVSAETLTA